MSFTDTKLERDYLFCRAFARLIRRDPGSGFDLGDTVELTHLAMEKTFEGDASRNVGGGEVVTIYGGTGRRDDPDEIPLSQLIERINERFGGNLTANDSLILTQVDTDVANDDPRDAWLDRSAPRIHAEARVARQRTCPSVS